MLIKKEQYNIVSILILAGRFALTRWKSFSILFFSFVLLAIVANYYKSSIGRELAHSYWPRESLEKKSILELNSYIFESIVNGV